MNTYDEKETNNYKPGYHSKLSDGLISNWPYANETPKQPKKIEIWFVDNKDGITIGEFKTAKAAKKFQQITTGVLRYYSPTAEERDKELTDSRQEKRVCTNW